MPGVRRFEDLDVWKLAVEIEDLVYALTESGDVLKDPNFITQIRKAASGPPAHYAEGFGRFRPKDHAQFVRYAKGSLEETRNHLWKGKRRRYFSEKDFEKVHLLVRRCLGATVRFIEYLDSCGGKLPWEVEPPPERPRKAAASAEPPEPKEPGTRNREPVEPEPVEPGTR